MRREETDQNGPLAQALRLLQGRRLDLQHHVPVPVELRGVGHDPGPCGGEGLVRMEGPGPGTRLHQHLGTELHETADDIRHGRDAVFARRTLFGYGDSHTDPLVIVIPWSSWSRGTAPL